METFLFFSFFFFYLDLIDQVISPICLSTFFVSLQRYQKNLNHMLNCNLKYGNLQQENSFSRLSFKPSPQIVCENLPSVLQTQFADMESRANVSICLFHPFSRCPILLREQDGTFNGPLSRQQQLRTAPAGLKAVRFI